MVYSSKLNTLYNLSDVHYPTESLTEKMDNPSLVLKWSLLKTISFVSVVKHNNK